MNGASSLNGTINLQPLLLLQLARSLVAYLDRILCKLERLPPLVVVVRIQESVINAIKLGTGQAVSVYNWAPTMVD